MKKKIFSLIILLFFLAILPLLVIYFRRTTVIRSKAAGSATMSLSGPSSVNVTDASFDVTVIVNTGGSPAVQSRGFDVSINFPTTRLQLVDIIFNTVSVSPTPGQSSMLKTFLPVNATTFDFDKTSVISRANSGQGLEFSAVPVVKSSLAGYPIPTVGAGTPTPAFVPVNATPVNNYVSGSVSLATLRFKPLSVGSAQIAFDFALEPTPGWRNDTNVSNMATSIADSTDLLASATGLTVNVTSSSTLTPTVTTSPTCLNGDLGNLNCFSTTDGYINEADLSILLRKWATVAPIPTPGVGQRSADISPGTGDGFVNEADLSKLLRNWRTL